MPVVSPLPSASPLGALQPRDPCARIVTPCIVTLTLTVTSQGCTSQGGDDTGMRPVLGFAVRLG
eukprot:339619-Pyramimonas_sp.AAC.1